MSSANPIDATVSEVKTAFLDFSTQIDAEVKAYVSSSQIINVNLPTITRCGGINISEKFKVEQNIVQFTNSDVAKGLSTILSTKMDAKLNQMNANFEKEFFDNIAKATASNSNIDKAKIKEEIKSSLHYSISTGVSSFATSQVNNQQTILFNPKGTARYLECKTLNIAAESIINMQMVQLTTLILDDLKDRNSKYAEAIQKIIEGENTSFLSKLMPNIFPPSKVVYVVTTAVAAVILLGIFILLLLLVINVFSKKKSSKK